MATIHRAMTVGLCVAMVLPLVLGAAGKQTVTISGGSFSPATIDVKVGDTVTWVNNDTSDHTVVGTGFKSDNLRPGASYSYQFPKAGTFTYACSYHPRMKATVNVSDK